MTQTTAIHPPPPLGRRRAVRVTSTSVVKQRFGDDVRRCPLIIEPTLDGVNLCRWAAENRETLESLLIEHGALLFRRFGVADVPTYNAFVRVFSEELLDYVERAAPRRAVAKGVYTSTEFPADQRIPQHHELAFSHRWPQLLWFFCLQPAESGGCTPLALARDVYAAIPDDVREPFERHGVLYVRNYGHGIDMGWEEAFQTRDRCQVERYCEDANTAFEWLPGNRLRTRHWRPATRRHPITGEIVWFNSAHLLHVSNLDHETRAALLAQLAVEDLPRNVFYGDGTPIPDEALDRIRQIYADCAVHVPWETGDVLMIDNLLVTHGREPFTGARRVLVSMARPDADPHTRA